MFLIRGERPVTDDIVIVTIGDETLESLNRRWPYPREYFAKLIENLEIAGAREIIFDIEFTENSTALQDSILASTAKKYDNIVFAGKIIHDITANAKKSQQIKPIRELNYKNSRWGVINIRTDKDGFVRSYPLFQTFHKSKINSISLEGIINKYENVTDQKAKLYHNGKIFQINDRIIPLSSYNTTFLNFYGPAGTFKRYPMSNVIDDSSFEIPTFDFDAFEEYLKNGDFEGKTVLIGVTSEEFHDNFPTPFLSQKGLMPGVEIHANFIEMFLQNNFLKNADYFLLAAINFILCLIVFAVFYWLKPVISGITTLALIIASLVLTFYLFSQNNLLVPIFQIPVMLSGIYLISLVLNYLRTLSERKYIKKAFSRYMAPDLVDELIKNPQNLKYGGHQKEISVLFSDIRSFTTYTESHATSETVAVLSEYLTAMVDVIIKHKGTLDKFVGDEIMALFGTPVSLENHALNACKVALDMRKVLSELQNKWEKSGIQPFEIGIGVNSGQAIVGNLGSEQIFDYTAIGDTINLGARLEALNKNYNTKNKIIISEFTLELVKDYVIAEYLDDVKVKGKTKAVKIYSLEGLK